ncbi:hypothetical protein PQR64_06755, partial [Paraburkholderia phytofirmans]|uniref:hypothetical protein n=1 Tax=Paraburkholderia phytofirmans TaxID=261302 RepID=UPI0038BC62B7
RCPFHLGTTIWAVALGFFHALAELRRTEFSYTSAHLSVVPVPWLRAARTHIHTIQTIFKMYKQFFNDRILIGFHDLKEPYIQ